MYRHICAHCLQQDKIVNHVQKDCGMVNKQSKNYRLAVDSVKWAAIKLSLKVGQATQMLGKKMAIR